MKKLLIVIRYLASVHLCGILFFMLFRSVLYFTNTHRIGEVENKISLFFTAFGKGLQFDNLIASHISLVPVLLLSLAAMSGKISKRAVYFCNLFFILLYLPAFAISAADIPYFSYSFTHVGMAALEWFKFGSDTAGMILGDSNYYPYLALWIVSAVAFSLSVRYFGRKLLRSTSFDTEKMNLYACIPLTVLVWLACFAGIRGSFQRYPLRTGYAYFSNHSFFNRLGVNPVFHFVKSHSGKRYMTVNDLMTSAEAVDLAQRELGISPDTDRQTPFVRFCKAEDGELKANVVIILMESMSAACLEYEYNGKNLTPFLHEMIEKSMYFENFYSSGIHTNNGIVSSLYGFPALFDKPMMKRGNNPSSVLYKGLPYCLHEKGYRNLFFITGNPNYDDMNEFLYNAYFDRIYSLYDYPPEKAVNNFGVQDDYLFEYGLKILNTAGRENAPFLATFLTVSNHSPIVVPSEFADYGDTDAKRIIAFADNSLRMFMESAEKEEWYGNTIFVLLGDHGAPVGTTKYDMHLSHNNIPCIIFSPLFNDMPKRFKQYGGQIDLFPTILGLLNCSFENNSPGINLLKETRPCMFFTTDAQLGCINDDYLYVRNLANRSDFLYSRHSENAENLEKEQTDMKDRLKNYALSMMISADYLLKH